MYSCFYESKKFLGGRCGEKHVNWGKKTENGENIFFEAPANRFWSTSKLISRVKEQQSCLWTTSIKWTS